MKNLKLLTTGLVLLMGIALTSCNNEPETPSTWAGIVRAGHDGSYTDAMGTRLIPTNPSYSTSMDMVYIYCRINKDQPVEAKSHSITLEADPIGLDAPSYLIEKPGAESDKVDNVATYSLAVNTGYYNLTPMFFDKNTLIVPVAFFIKSNVTSTTLAEEVAKHKFELAYYLDSAKSGDTELNIHLRHTVVDPETSRSGGQKTWAYKAYNLTDILDFFKKASGSSKPTRVIVHVKENDLSDKLIEARDEEYEIDYKFDL